MPAHRAPETAKPRTRFLPQRGKYMGDLGSYRKSLDEIDRELTALYERRMAIADEIAEYKIGAGLPVLDPEREAAKLASVEAMVTNKENRLGVREFFEQLMAMSRKRQYSRIRESSAGAARLPFIEIDKLVDGDTTAVYQGDRGSYSEAAAMRFFGAAAELIPAATFRDAMVAIEEGRAQYAVLPIENSTAGIVSAIYDLLTEFENYIVGEVIIPIRHCLLAAEGADLSTVRIVYSHAQSLMQCERYLAGHPEWQQVSMLNNAFAADKVARDRDPAEAAIAGAHAARVYGLNILEEGINQSESNSTRFIVVTNQKVFLKGARKISLSLELKHESGSLYHALSHIIYNNLNMTKIESRPIEDRNWEYRFFIDFDGSLRDPGVQNALRGLRDETRNLRVLGNY